MKYKDFMKTETYMYANVIDFLKRDYTEVDVVDEELFYDVEVLEVNQSKCVGLIEVVFDVE